MDNEMNVKLGLDTSSYEKSIDGALKVFNSFQTKLNDTKLGFNPSQVSELHKIFTDIRSTATSELAKIQKRIDSLNAKNVKLDFEYTSTSKEIEGLQKEIEITWNPTKRAKLENQLDTLQQKLNALDGELTINEGDLKDAETDYNFLLKELQVNPLEFDFESPSLIKFNTMIDNVLNGLKRTGEEAEDTGDKIDEMGKKANAAARNSTRLNLMGRIFSQIKNTIASAINPLNMFRRGWNEIIMSDDSKFGNTFKNIAANINTALTPVFEKIAQWIINLIGYINVFVKALSGGKTDLFAKSAKSAKSTAKSVAEANKQLAGFDEINDIGDSSGRSSAGLTGDVGTVEPNLKEEWVKKLTEWGEKIKEIWETIKEFFNNIKDNIGTIGLVTFGLAALVGVFLLLGKVMGGITGPLIGIGIALVGVASVLFSISYLMSTMEETGTSIGELALIMVTTLGSLSVAVIAFAEATKLIDLVGLAALVVIFAGMVAVITVIKDLLVTMTENGISATDMLATMGVVIGSVILAVAGLTAAAMVLGSNPLALIAVVALAGALVAILLVMEKVVPVILDALASFFERTGPIMVQILDKVLQIIDRILDTVDNLVNNLLKPILVPLINNIGGFLNNLITTIGKLIGKMGEFFNNVKSKIVDVFTKGGEIFKGIRDGFLDICKTIINAILKGANAVIKLPFQGVNGILNTIRNISFLGISPFKGLWKQNPLPVPQIPLLNVGTEYVPEDMLAMIHKGEAVIPKEFNEKSYFSGMSNNEETNRLLEQVIDAINNIEMNPYTTVKDVGNASIQYIKDKSRQLGRSVI